MNKYTKISLIVCVMVIMAIIISFLWYLYFPWIILPTESLPKTLTLVGNGGNYPRKITLRQYINNVNICDYVLEMQIGLRYQTVQRYKLPLLNEGKIQIYIELDDSEDSIIFISHNQLTDFYKNGLLIYAMEDFSLMKHYNGYDYYDKYLYLKSGKEEVRYHKGLEKWTIVSDAPRIKRFVREEITYSSGCYGWNENKWEILPLEN